MGKSAFALQAAAGVASKGHAAIVVSAEMPADQVVARLLAQESGVLHARIAGERGKMRKEDWTALTPHVARVERLPMSVVYVPAATTMQVRSAVRRELAKLRRTYGADLELGMIVVDHVHIMNGEPQRGEDERAVLTRLSRGNLWMVGEFGCAVLELAQLNRGVEGRPDKRPNMSDLRGTGSLEEDAHTILFPFNPAYYDKERKVDSLDDKAPPDEAEIIIGKQRGGGGGSVKVAFHGQTLRFFDVARQEDGYEECFDDGRFG
jgi:replicative DNA helicase